MDERLKETLSAMMDDQADELSVRRLLSHGDHGDIRDQWRRWQQVRDLMHDRVSPVVDVSSRVRESLVDGAAPKSAPARGRLVTASGRAWHWTGAAAVALALAVGFGAGAGWDASEPDTPVVAGAVSATSSGNESEIPEVALQGLNEEQWEHLSRYLLEHAQHSSVGSGSGSMGYARLASVSGPVGQTH
ncbi:sigma-E factor negative regulatory protein [Marinobacter salicampi]|uniref:sigma-E factor negative regulatory protein n=1 Tax=Marinobacter salicampi TaxID=435907 RepID=UPI00140CBB30|nr:sigma-E factor negative regulatory protein [Marinobacter salicampi]